MDKAVNFNTTLKNVNNYLNRLEKIGLNVTEFKKLRDEIINENALEVAKSYDYAHMETFGQTAFLEQTYISSNTKLERLYQTIIKYDVYVQAASFISVLKTFISNKNKTIDEVTKVRESLILLLNKLYNSETLDYTVEGQIFEDLYALTYLFIKEEISLLNVSPTLELVKENEVLKDNLASLIIKEIETLNLNDSKYTEVKKIYAEIEAADILNRDYCSLKLLKALVNSQIPTANKQQLFDDLSNKLTVYYQELESLQKKIISKKINLGMVKKDLENYYKKLTLNIGIVAVTLSTVLASCIGGLMISKKIAQEKVYRNTTTTYDSLTGAENVTTAYSDNATDGVFLHEYRPFEQSPSKKNTSFTREHLSYDLSNLEELTFEDYLKLDLKALGIEPKILKENKDELTLSDLYTQTYQVLEKTVVNENDFKTINNVEEQKLFSILSWVGIILIFVISEGVFYENGDNVSIIYAFDNIFATITQIKNKKMSRQEYEKTINELLKQVQKTISENSYIMENLMELIPYLKKINPATTKTEETMELIKKIKF